MNYLIRISPFIGNIVTILISKIIKPHFYIELLAIKSSLNLDCNKTFIGMECVNYDQHGSMARHISHSAPFNLAKVISITSQSQDNVVHFFGMHIFLGCALQCMVHSSSSQNHITITLSQLP